MLQMELPMDIKVYDQIPLRAFICSSCSYNSCRNAGWFFGLPKVIQDRFKRRNLLPRKALNAWNGHYSSFSIPKSSFRPDPLSGHNTTTNASCVCSHTYRCQPNSEQTSFWRSILQHFRKRKLDKLKSSLFSSWRNTGELHAPVISHLRKNASFHYVKAEWVPETVWTFLRREK